MNNWQIIRVVLLMFLLGCTFVATYLFYEHELYFCMFFSIIWGITIMLYMIYSHYETTRKMVRMVEAIRFGDFSLSFPDKKQGSMESQLVGDINAAMAEFRTQLSQKEGRYKYFETLLDTVDTCMLVADGQGQVLWMNRASVQDLCGHTIHQLEELKKLNQEFPVLLETLQPGEVKVVRIYRGEVMQDMAVTVTEYITMGADLRLINLKNIRSVLEKNEMEAWQKLVRVLTHEIMNSITPIISLSETLYERALQSGMEKESVVLQGMKTIHRRSKGLLGFVENYRKLSRLSSPILAPVTVGELIDDIKKLFLVSNVHYIYRIEDESLSLMIDRSQIEQVLINLLKNAGEACGEQPNPEVIIETCCQPEKHIFQLSVKDNGNGILPEALDKIFIPFFTTKPTGSGIGLSLCKQIMALHGGSIQVTTEVGKGSCFTLKFFVFSPR